MQDNRHTDGRVAQFAAGSTRSRASPSTRSHHDGAGHDGRECGRSATHPLEVPARGWKDILFRVWKNIGKDRVIVVAAGVTFYSVLALFPAIAALVAVYGFFADPTTIASHLDSIAGMVPTGAIEVIRDQITRVASQGRAILGLTFLAGFAASLWSANAGMKSLFDALNLVYNEPEKRLHLAQSYIVDVYDVNDHLRAPCIGCNGYRPNRIKLRRAWRRDGNGDQDRALAGFVDSNHLGARDPLSLRAEPRKAAMALDHLGQRRCGRLVVGHFDTLFLVCGEFWQLQQNLRLSRRYHRIHVLDLALDHRCAARSRA
jgi:hypothetical protein